MSVSSSCLTIQGGRRTQPIKSKKKWLSRASLYIFHSNHVDSSQHHLSSSLKRNIGLDDASCMRCDFAAEIGTASPDYLIPFKFAI